VTTVRFATNMEDVLAAVGGDKLYSQHSTEFLSLTSASCNSNLFIYKKQLIFAARKPQLMTVIKGAVKKRASIQTVITTAIFKRGPHWDGQLTVSNFFYAPVKIFLKSYYLETSNPHGSGKVTLPVAVWQRYSLHCRENKFMYSNLN
jgi:hypothetical protein